MTYLAEHLRSVASENVPDDMIDLLEEGITRKNMNPAKVAFVRVTDVIPVDGGFRVVVAAFFDAKSPVVGVYRDQPAPVELDDWFTKV